MAIRACWIWPILSSNPPVERLEPLVHVVVEAAHAHERGGDPGQDQREDVLQPETVHQEDRAADRREEQGRSVVRLDDHEARS